MLAVSYFKKESTVNFESLSLVCAGLEFVSEGESISVDRPVVVGDSVTITAAAGADMFLDPAGSENHPDGERFVQRVEGDFQFSAFVEVNFQADFDSGVLLGFVDNTTWFKICAELDPDGTRRVVSVVTRDGASDDSNGWAIGEEGIHLRISRMGAAFALHASQDGATWSMIRYFSLGQQTPNAIKVGILAQSPAGLGTSARFTQMRLSRSLLINVRGGE
jgi:uncharacterized protein